MELISLKDCNISDGRQTLLKNISWQMNAGECWLIIGANNSGKSHFLNTLAGATGITSAPELFSVFGNSVELVSLERAATIIQEEREADESDYVEGGVDIGRIGRVFIAEPLTGRIRKGAELPEIVRRIETYPAIKLCGVENILERGIKYMSTGEVRRTLLARALVSGKRLLILSNPFAGLDVESRTILLNFFNTIAKKQISSSASEKTSAGDSISDGIRASDNTSDSACASDNTSASGGTIDNTGFPCLILAADRYTEIPDAITHVLEFEKDVISFCGNRNDYETLLEKRNAEKAKNRNAEKANLFAEVNELSAARETITQTQQNAKSAATAATNADTEKDAAANAPEKIEKVPLIQMNHVNVGWGENRVLVDLTWALHRKEHWLIRGPNGSGKTTFLELITGDNMQVFSNDVRLFGKRRGSGETIWDIKKQLGIVSYRLHVEYRMVGNTTLQNVIVSGFHDSIGLYEKPLDTEIDAALKWLSLGGFANRHNDLFGNLSYGEQRAVLILRAAVKNPPVLILDEPCHGLDENFRQKILDLLEIVAENGNSTLLHVTHEADEVLPCEHHILELLPKQQPMYRIIEK